MESKVVVWITRGSGITLAVVPALLLVLWAEWPVVVAVISMAVVFVLAAAVASILFNAFGEGRAVVYLLSWPLVYAGILTTASSVVFAVIFGGGFPVAVVLLVSAVMMAATMEKTPEED